MERQILRAASVGAAMACDIVINYPLWIVAKRVGAGLSALPPLHRLYAGGGALWASIAPTTIIEDGVSTVLKPRCGDLAASAASGAMQCANQFTAPSHAIDASLDSLVDSHTGAIAGVCVTSQVERCITAAHARSLSVRETAVAIHRRGGVAGLLLPPGMAATACREVPFAAALFAVRPRLKRIAEERYPTTQRFLRELSCGVAAASVAGPASHAPSVVAAYQQATDVTPRQAIAKIYAAGGLREFFRGLPARTVSLAGTFTVVPLALDWFAIQ